MPAATAAWWPAIVLIALAGGCSRQPPRCALEGTVACDGQPLATGYIRFRPEDETAGPTAGGAIQEGKFVIPAADGTFPGRFRVEITASRASGKTIVDDFSGNAAAEYQQFLPPRYNTQSELTVDVTGGGENRFEFTVLSH